MKKIIFTLLPAISLYFGTCYVAIAQDSGVAQSDQITADGQELFTVSGGGAVAFNDVAFSPDGARLATTFTIADKSAEKGRVVSGGRCPGRRAGRAGRFATRTACAGDVQPRDGGRGARHARWLSGSLRGGLRRCVSLPSV